MRASDHILNKDCYLGAIRVYQILFPPQSIFSLFDLEKKKITYLDLVIKGWPRDQSATPGNHRSIGRGVMYPLHLQTVA